MKSTLLSFVLCFAVYATNATVTVVDNNGNAPAGVKTDLTTAITEATAGDTLLVIPSSTRYGSTVTVSKPLTIIGSGFNPDSEGKLTAQVRNLTIATPASGVKIIGMVITDRIRFGTVSGALQNILIENCQIGYMDGLSITSLTNVLIRQNLIQTGINTSIISLAVANQANIRFVNNVISTFQSNHPITISNGGVTFDHNTFIGAGTAFSSIKSIVISNNIFLNVSPSVSNATSATNVVYKNNLSNTKDFNTTDILGTNLTYEGNLSKATPAFSSMLSTVTNYTLGDDPALQTGSAGESAATDGTDLGAVGGTSAFKLSGSTLPIVKKFDVPSNITQGASSTPAPLEVTGN